MKLKYLFFLIILIWFSSCSPTKFVPEGDYLLDRVEIKSNNKDVYSDELYEYLRQNSNSYVFGLFRMQLGIYNLAGRDSSKWLNRTLKKIGQAPVILDPTLTSVSAKQIQLYCINKGFMNAQVDADIQRSNKKARLIYSIDAGKPYVIENYDVQVQDSFLNSIAGDSARSYVNRNMNFDVDVLNAERDRIASRMREQGYYNFNKDLLEYVADSGEHKINVNLGLKEYLTQPGQNPAETIFRKFYVNKVIYRILQSTANITDTDNQLQYDTVSLGRYTMIGPKERIMTLSSLISNTYVEPDALYKDKDVERTYSSLNSLGPVKYVNVNFTAVGPDSLDCNINISPAKTFSLSAQSEITFTEGYWGLAGNLGMNFRNIFRGAETLNMQFRGGLEKQNDVLAQEWGAQLGLRIPRMIMPLLDYRFKRNFQGNTEFKSSYNYQFRPGEFTVINVGGGVNYVWHSNNQTHRFDLMDLSYVYFPEISAAFRETFLNTGKYNIYNYENHLIMRLGYANSFSGFNPARPMRNFTSYRYSVETAGNLLQGLSNLLKAVPDESGYYQIFNIRYSQYARGEFNYSFNQVLDKNNKLVYHAGVGLGVPYGNAEVIPFERRFYSGGANSVRGWSESTLGPGAYQRINLRLRDYNQVGDVKLDLNFEYRSKMFWVLEGAAFFDAGNIWTIRDYSYQPGGQFLSDKFYEQIAMAYGLGVRMDFSFFLLRFDVGAKLFDPARLPAEQWRFKLNSDDFAFHIAIGYPF